MRNRSFLVPAELLVPVLALMAVGLLFPPAASAQNEVPIYEVDPFWPKTPLPNNWVLGNVIGTAVDPANDHVWIVHRPAALTANEIPLYHNPPTGEDCCMPAPPILEFDQDGNLVGHFGPLVAGGENWADAEHGIFVDHLGNIWTGGGGTGASSSDSAVFKFAQDGTLLKRFGTKGAVYSSHDLENFGRPADFWVQQETNELWVADGYTNRRLIVLDATTGEYKRHWGAYGNAPVDAPMSYDPQAPPSQQFRPPVHCIVIAEDGLVYMCDRGNDRIQVFTQDGKFVQERFIAKNTTSAGSVWDIALSKDAEQRFLFLVDGINHRIRVLNRSDLNQVSEFGHHGRWAGGFYAAHSIGMDSHQNIYIGETWEGKRVQKFVYRGMGPRADN